MRICRAGKMKSHPVGRRWRPLSADRSEAQIEPVRVRQDSFINKQEANASCLFINYVHERALGAGGARLAPTETKWRPNLFESDRTRI